MLIACYSLFPSRVAAIPMELLSEATSLCQLFFRYKSHSFLVIFVLCCPIAPWVRSVLH